MSVGINTRWFGMLALCFALAISGCSGGNSVTGEEEVTFVAQTYNEQCSLCHRADSIAAVSEVHNRAAGTIQPGGEITSVAIDDVSGRVTVNFALFDSTNSLIPLAGVQANNIRFTIAKLVSAGAGLYNWQSYLNTTETKTAGDPGTAVDGNTAIQATYELASNAEGVFTDNGDGTYTYVMSIDINSITSPLSVNYEPTLTHRVAMQVEDNAYNPVYDFVPSGGALPAAKEVVTNSSCNECHRQLAFHGGDRIQTDYCVTCHNPGTSDANSANNLDFKVMIHKIHAGETLPAVEAGGEYAIWGFRDVKHNYSTVVYPQDLRHCTKCHTAADAATPEGDNWKTVPSVAACTTCHGVPDATLYPDFPNLTPTQIEQVHQIPAEIASARFQFNIINVANTNPGQQPVVTFSVTDPTNSDVAYDIFVDAPFTASGGASRLAVLIGWPTTAYTNIDSSEVPAQPVSINVLNPGAVTDNGDGTYTVVSPTAIPASVTGSGAAALEGHPAGDFDGDGVYTDRVPVTNAVQAFPITDNTAVARSTVVELSSCNQCHHTLSLHGNNRTDNIGVCVICHNANATDIRVRPPESETLDGRDEQAINFTYMIHAIHAGEADLHGYRQEGVVIYGFGSRPHDFSDVRLPSGLENLKNCTGCHADSTFAVPISESALPTTTSTESNLASPVDDINITPTAAACSSCHDALASKTHMTEEGAMFDFVPLVPETSTGSGDGETALCGPGPISAQPAGHTSRTDCCSCHGFQ